MKKLKLLNNQYALIDDDFFNELSKFKWGVNNRGYIRRRIGSYKKRTIRHVSIHRFIMGAKKGEIVDHINGNKLDNRRSNLRLCNNAQNSMNRGMGKNNTSGVKGVCWHKNRKKWQSSLQFNRKTIYLGYFVNKKDAVLAYDKGARKWFKEFARLNSSIMV